MFSFNTDLVLYMTETVSFLLLLFVSDTVDYVFPSEIMNYIPQISVKRN